MLLKNLISRDYKNCGNQLQNYKNVIYATFTSFLETAGNWALQVLSFTLAIINEWNGIMLVKKVCCNDN